MADAAGLFARAEALVQRDGGVHPPPEVLLSWPVPNYVNPEDRGWDSSIILMIVLGITFVIYTVRMWARLVVAKNAGLDDILMSVAMLPAFGLTISAILGMSILSVGEKSLTASSYQGLWLPMARMGSDTSESDHVPRGTFTIRNLRSSFS
jgi:hypothetical protein